MSGPSPPFRKGKDGESIAGSGFKVGGMLFFMSECNFTDSISINHLRLSVNDNNKKQIWRVIVLNDQIS